MVEHAVQHHLDARRVQRPAHLLKILVGAQAAVQAAVVPGVVAVGVGFKGRVEQHRARAQLFQMGHPVQHPQDAGAHLAVVLRGRAAQAQGIDLIKYAFVKPHKNLLNLFVLGLVYHKCGRLCHHRAFRPPRKKPGA